MTKKIQFIIGLSLCFTLLFTAMPSAHAVYSSRIGSYIPVIREHIRQAQALHGTGSPDGGCRAGD